jgi:hypothetical protein
MSIFDKPTKRQNEIVGFVAIAVAIFAVVFGALWVAVANLIVAAGAFSRARAASTSQDEQSSGTS